MDESGRLQDRQADRQVPAVLSELLLTGLAFLLQLVESGNHHTSSWMMMLAVMYGMMPSANADSLSSAPPEKQVDQRIDVLGCPELGVQQVLMAPVLVFGVGPSAHP